MKKIVTHTLVPHKSWRCIALMCLALFSLAATGSAQNLLTKTGGLTADPLQAIDQYGAIGSGKGLSLSGAILDAPLTTDITSSTTGRVWMGLNLGATQVATSISDTNAFGYLYQWGRGTDGHQIRGSLSIASQSATTTVPSPNTAKFIKSFSSNWLTAENTNLWQGIGGINNPCPAGYYVPTKAEFEAELILETQDAFTRFKMTYSGYRNYGDFTLSGSSQGSKYWTSTIGSIANFPYHQEITTASASVGASLGAANGMSVRCIKGTITSSVTNRIWMDRNLGAKEIANSAGSNTDSYGDLYQWGRGTDGHEKITSDPLGTLSTSNTPGHGDFIVNSSAGDWLSSLDNTLWQGVAGINNPCPSGFRIPTKGEFELEGVSVIGTNLKIPLSGSRYSSNGVFNSSTYLWTSSIGVSDGRKAQVLRWFVNSFIIGESFRGNGYAIRCIQD
ncbi:hypothetical protein [Flavobacterium sp. W22_SRS_FP1]|uniref:hypothetical protein n=1 Tax=Flavobacterium sp. W22_SRS_FP1 TaxID=3240276 RepID=UPI003F9105E3